MITVGDTYQRKRDASQIKLLYFTIVCHFQKHRKIEIYVFGFQQGEKEFFFSIFEFLTRQLEAIRRLLRDQSQNASTLSLNIFPNDIVIEGGNILKNNILNLEEVDGFINL